MGLYEIRFHGRGGQGAWTASQLLALAALSEGKQVQSFPEFGPERMGAPITSYTRISDEKIRIHSNIYAPDVVLVLDSTIMSAVNVLEGLKEGGFLIVNTPKQPDQLRNELNISSTFRVGTVPATDLAIRVLGRDIANTAMLGALIKAKPIVSLSSILQVVKERFKGKVGELNAELIKSAYERVKVG